MRRKTKTRLAFLLLAGLVIAVAKNPHDEGRSGIITPDDSYFAALGPVL